eukprot:GHVH01003711.1.p1 GENE.GHVH01003711.1~~GHVH01003711.1.p1  ORF type:complete len:568 (+),score=75.42 GHVH01003711.1:101-1804(+)
MSPRPIKFQVETLESSDSFDERHPNTALNGILDSTELGKANWVEQCLNCGYQSLVNRGEGNCPHCTDLHSHHMRAVSMLDSLKGNPLKFTGNLRRCDPRDILRKTMPLQDRGLVVGVWDGLHVGTIASLFACSEQTHSLTVGVYNDITVATVTHMAPIFSLEERRRMISSLRVVDRIIFNLPLEPVAYYLDYMKCTHLLVNIQYQNHMALHPFTKGRENVLEKLKGKRQDGSFSENFLHLFKTGKIREASNFSETDRCDALILVYLLRLAVKYCASITQHTELESKFKPKPELNKSMSMFRSRTVSDILSDDEERDARQLDDPRAFKLPHTWAQLRKRDNSQQVILSSRMLMTQKMSQDVRYQDAIPQPGFGQPDDEENHTQISRSDSGLARSFSSTKKNEVVVFLDGAFDILHPGHFDLIDCARKTFGATKLVVGVLSDESIFKATRELPCFSMLERAVVLSGLKGVDEVVYDCPWIVNGELLRRYRVDVVLQRLELYPRCGYGYDVSKLDWRNIYKSPLNELVIPVEKCTVTVTTKDVLLRVISQIDFINSTFKENEKRCSEDKE